MSGDEAFVVVVVVVVKFGVVIVMEAGVVVCNSWTDMNTCRPGVFRWEKPVTHPAGVWAWLRNVGVSTGM